MEIFNKTVPPAWLDILSLVHSISPEALLAGGCLRDLILGGEVKDLDIFVDASNEDRWEDLRNILQFRHGWRPVTQINADYVTSMRSEVAKVIGFRVPLASWFHVPQEVQIIGLKRLLYPMDALNRMDFGACQIGVTMGNHVFYTPAAHKDLTERTITMLEPEDHVQAFRSLSRAARFAEKYEGTDVRVISTGPTTRISQSFDEFRWTYLGNMDALTHALLGRDRYDEALGG